MSIFVELLPLVDRMHRHWMRKYYTDRVNEHLSVEFSSKHCKNRIDQISNKLFEVIGNIYLPFLSSKKIWFFNDQSFDRTRYRSDPYSSLIFKEQARVNNRPRISYRYDWRWRVEISSFDVIRNKLQCRLKRKRPCNNRKTFLLRQFFLILQLQEQLHPDLDGRTEPKHIIGLRLRIYWFFPALFFSEWKMAVSSVIWEIRAWNWSKHKLDANSKFKIEWMLLPEPETKRSP